MVGRAHAKRLTDELAAAARSFDETKRCIEVLLTEGVATLSDWTAEPLYSFEDRLSTLVVESVRFSSVLETTWATPVMRIPREPIHPDSDQFAIREELMKASAAITDATEKIANMTRGEEREHYIVELLRATTVLSQLLGPLLSAESGTTN